MKRSLFILAGLAFLLTTQNSLNAQPVYDGDLLETVVLDQNLSATNYQFSLAWYKGALLFSSDRSSPKGSAKPSKTQLFFAKGIYDFEKDQIGEWLPVEQLKTVKSSAADRAFAYDQNADIHYVMRCPTPAKGKPLSCNIVAYHVNEKGKMEKPANQSFHDEEAIIGYPTLSSDGNVMLFSMRKDGSFDLYVTKKTGKNTWETPVKLPASINTDSAENHPQLFNDGLLYFVSNGHKGHGGLDIFSSHIMVRGQRHKLSANSNLNELEFSTPENMGMPVNSSADDVSMLMQSNGKGGYFISNREVNGTKNANIYRFDQKIVCGTSPAAANADGKPIVITRVDTVFVRDTLRIFELSEENYPKGDIIHVYTDSGVREVREVLIDTVYVEKVVEVEKIVEVEKFVGGNAEQSEILKDKDAQLSKKDNEISRLNTALAECQTATASAQPQQADNKAVTSKPIAPAQTAKTSSGTVYRVQIAASANAATQSEFQLTFSALHQSLPELKTETIRGSDGYYRYLSVPLSYAEADALRQKIQSLGYQCFVAGYQGNERVSMSVK